MDMTMDSTKAQGEAFYREHGREGAKAYAASISKYRPIWLEFVCEWIDYFADMDEMENR